MIRRRNHQETGQAKEALAEQFLLKHKLKVIARNARSPYGEIDLIMRDERDSEPVMVFVEVRYRESDAFGGALASVNALKQQKIIKTAQHYLQKNPQSIACRFDVIAFEGDKLEWIENAFTL